MKGTISMSIKETERITIMDNLIAKRIKQKHASVQLGISIRQVQRLLKRYKREGATGLTHKSRGRIGNRALSQENKDRIVLLIRQHYPDFGPTLAAEKLLERHGIAYSVETVRKLMMEHALWKEKKRRIEDVHTYRERRSCVGELIQVDGSFHAWFEDRADPCALLGFIDDATSQIMDGAFATYEGTFPLFSAAGHYLVTYGKPLAYYVDRHSTYKVNRQATIEEELRNSQAQSQFARAMEELRIELIYALSPQAKGRVERLFETLQDRLVKELRLEGISDKQEATRYFREIYIPKHNAKFAVPPKEKTNMHRPLLSTDELKRIFTLQSRRLVSKALVVQYKNTKYQLLPPSGSTYTLKKTAVMIEEAENGTVTFRYNHAAMPYRVITQEIQQVPTAQIVTGKTFQEQRVNIPGKDHPWRIRFMPV